MTASVLQSNRNAQLAGASSWTITLPSTSAGSMLLLDVYVNDGRTISGVSDDSSNAWAALQAVTDGSLQVRQWRAYNIAAKASTLTVTITFDAGTATVGASIREIGGVKTSSAIIGNTGQSQTNPGTSTDAVTSGATSHSSATVLVLGTSVRRDGTTACSAGTGFTSDTSGAAFYADYQTRLESKRVTGANQAATFTAGGATDDFITLAVVVEEASAVGGAGYYYGAWT